MVSSSGPIGLPDNYYRMGNRTMAGENIAKEAIVTLLQYLGYEPQEEGLEDTPLRVLKALSEMTEGKWQSPEKILSRRFRLSHDEMIVLKDVPFVSLCEHHILPFTGTASVCYVPANGEVVGLSKLARLVHCFAKRLQVQERMTGQIANALMEHLKPVGAACVVKAVHSCLACRGAKISEAVFVTSALRGVLKEDPRARAELMALIS